MRWLLILALLSPVARIVATLDGRPITSVELGRYTDLFHPGLAPGPALEQLIRLYLLDLQAQRYQMTVSPDQVRQQLARLDPDGQVRRRWAMDEDDLRGWAVRQARVQSFLHERFFRWRQGDARAEIDALVRELELRWIVQRQL